MWCRKWRRTPGQASFDGFRTLVNSCSRPSGSPTLPSTSRPGPLSATVADPSEWSTTDSSEARPSTTWSIELLTSAQSKCSLPGAPVPPTHMPGRWRT